MRFYFDIPEHISPLRRSPYLELVEITLKIQTNIIDFLNASKARKKDPKKMPPKKVI